MQKFGDLLIWYVYRKEFKLLALINVLICSKLSIENKNFNLKGTLSLHRPALFAN